MLFGRSFRALKAVFIITAVTLVLNVPGSVQAAGTAVVTVVGPAQAVSPGQQFLINIDVNPNNAIAGAQFNLSFNSSLVTVDNVTEGNLLRQGGASTYFMPGHIDNAAGNVTAVSGAIISPGQTVTAAGTFAVVTMTAKSTAGTCPLNLSNVIVGDINGQAVPVNVVNGQVVISAGNSPPVLAAIGNKSVTAGQLLQFTISATDPNGDNLTYSASNLPQGASFNAAIRTFSWTPTTAEVGTYSNVHFQVSDGSLTDSENITITVNAPTPPAGGGGGGGGLPPSDRTPPVISNVVVRNTTRTSVEILWTTNEESTSQVKYGASPESLSPLDETTLIDHDVKLTDLKPYTTYRFWVMSRDRANNLAVSEEYSFTTLGEPATFTVSTLEISPAEIRVGEQITISVTVTNIGDVAGSYEVNLSISAGSGSEIMKQTVELDAGTSQKVTFVTTKKTAGVFMASVGDLKTSFTVKEALGSAVAPVSPKPEITLFSVIPAGYDSVTLQPTSARVTYQVKNLTGSVTDAGLVLKVSLNGEPLESVVLISPGQPISDTGVSSWDYIPSVGWENGTYTFLAELSAGGTLCATTSEETLEIKTQPAAVISWSTLAAIIGGVLIAIAAVLVVLLRRRREIVRAWVENRPSSTGTARRTGKE